MLHLPLPRAAGMNDLMQAFEAARLEEEYNVERWGMIEGGHDMDRVNTKLTLTAASTLLWLRKVPLPKPKMTER